MKHLKTLEELNFFRRFFKNQWLAFDVEGTSYMPYAVGFGNTEIGIYSTKDVKPPKDYFSKYYLVGCGIDNDKKRLIDVENVSEKQPFIDIQLMAKAFGLPSSLDKLGEMVGEKKLDKPGKDGWYPLNERLLNYLNQDVVICAKVFRQLAFLSRMQNNKATLSTCVMESITCKPKSLIKDASKSSHLPFELTVRVPKSPTLLTISDIKRLILTKSTTCNKILLRTYILKFFNAFMPGTKAIWQADVEGRKKSGDVPRLLELVPVIDRKISYIVHDEFIRKDMSLILAFCNTLATAVSPHPIKIEEIEALECCNIIKTLLKSTITES